MRSSVSTMHASESKRGARTTTQCARIVPWGNWRRTNSGNCINLKTASPLTYEWCTRRGKVNVTPEIAVVDLGYKGVDIEGVKIYHPGLRRGITRGLRAMIRSRSAIEPAIGHMKTDGKLDRNWLKGALGDAMHAVLCGAGHNLRILLRKLKDFNVLILAALLTPLVRIMPGA